MDPIAAVRRWLVESVIGRNLCPFARRPFLAEKVEFCCSTAQSAEQLLVDLETALQALARQPDVSTTLLIHPQVLQDFADYNQFLDAADALLQSLGYEGVFQIASFHPDYQFAGTSHNDAENYSNRSPYPLLHLLREAELSVAVDAHRDPDGIPDRNIQKLREIGTAQLEAELQALRSAP